MPRVAATAAPALNRSEAPAATAAAVLLLLLFLETAAIASFSSAWRPEEDVRMAAARRAAERAPARWHAIWRLFVDADVDVNEESKDVFTAKAMAFSKSGRAEELSARRRLSLRIGEVRRGGFVRTRRFCIFVT